MRKAAEGGVPEAQLELGRIYAEGDGVDMDVEQAIQWYLVLAARGSADAQHWAAMLYSHGDSAAVDLVQAYKWANLSATLGHPSAPELRDALKKRMTKRQVAEAQQLSRQWYEAQQEAR